MCGAEGATKVDRFTRYVLLNILHTKKPWKFDLETKS